MNSSDTQSHLTRVLDTKAASLRRLAEAAGLDPAQLSRFKSSGAGLSAEKLAALGKALRRFDPAVHSSIEPAHIANLGDCLYRRELSVFVGAGLSHLAPHQSDPRKRLPLWPGLAEGLARHLGQPAPSGSDTVRSIDRLSAACGENKVREAIPAVLNADDFGLSKAHEMLARLPWLNVITTNYDGLLDTALPQRACRRPIVREEDYARRARHPESRTDRRILNLVHLHGDLEHPHTLFSSDYCNWPAKHPQAHQFLREILSTPHCVLFLGYGLGDPHLRDLLDMVRDLTRAQNRLYAWMWNLDSLDRELLARDNILTGSIDSESGWADALELLEARLETIEEGTAESVESPVTLAAKPDERGNYALTVTEALERVNLTQYYIGETHTGGAITLRDLYVAPDVVPAEAAEKTPASRGKGKAPAASILAGELHLAGMEAGERTDRCSSIQAWLEKHSRLVLLGEPGQGKSTLLRRLVMDGLEAWKDQPEKPPRFPFFIQLSHWERDCPPGQPMREYALDLLVASYGLPREAYEQWLEPGVLWLLDGVDEVRDDARRKTLIGELNKLAGKRDAILFTSRPAGYFEGEDRKHLGKSWSEVRLAPLSEPQSLEMLTKIFAVFQRLEGLAVSAEGVFRQLGRETSLARLGRNALQLTMIAVFFRSRRELPRDRWVFYTFATEYLMRTRAAQRSEAGPGVKSAAALSFDLSPGDVHDLFRSLATQMMKEGQVTLHKDEFLRLARGHFSTRGRKGPALEAAVENVLRAAQGLNGVLVERGRELFGFVHLTYQEFYAAWWLNVQQSDAEKLVATHGLEETWAVVWDLYVLSLDNNDQRLCHLHNSLPADEARLRRLRWLGLGPAPWEKICPDAIFLWACKALTNVKSTEGAEVLLTLANWERSYPDCIRTALTALLSSGENESRHTAAQALGEQAAGRELLTALLGILSGADDMARGFAEYALAIPARAGDPVVTPELRKLYEDPAATTQARAAATRALGGAVPALPLWPVPAGREEVVLSLAPGVDISFLKVTEAGTPFWLQRTQVTQAQWLALLGGENPAHFKGEHLPVENVDWQMSQDFCAALAKHPAFLAEFGRQWQPGLPLEKDWETACRAGKKGEFNTGAEGDGQSLGSHLANFNGNHPEGKAGKGVHRQRTVAVGSFPPNDWGFHDLHGNVWEWCEDADGSNRVIRGGSWFILGLNCRSANRLRGTPEDRSIYLGFRVALVQSRP